MWFSTVVSYLEGISYATLCFYILGNTDRKAFQDVLRFIIKLVVVMVTNNGTREHNLLSLLTQECRNVIRCLHFTDTPTLPSFEMNSQQNQGDI